MNIIITILQVIAAVAGGLAALVAIPLFFSFRWPAAAMWGAKVFVSALSPLLGLVGVVVAAIGLATGSTFVSALGILVVAVYGVHFLSITRPPHAANGFQQAFGVHWANGFRPAQKDGFLAKRTVLRLPPVPKPRLEQDVVFATLPGTGRKLLCDVWQPSEQVTPSRLAFIYMHGSAFYFLDKDYGTRPLFQHLAAQGHVVMDVAYRLAHETGIMGMIHDVKRAVAWMKEQAATYGIDPALIVVGGASAGGHLALMTAYTQSDPQFTPEELQGKDISVRGVVSLYGPTDLEGLYYHTNQHLTTRTTAGQAKKKVPTGMPRWMKKSIGKDYHRLGLDNRFEEVGTLPPLLGGHPDECPERYAMLSPLAHVHAACPPTLLIHGEHDIMAPVQTTRTLYTRLVEKGVPAVLHILPQTDHAFDLVLPVINPGAHNAFYDVERFLALMAAPRGAVVTKATFTIESVAPGGDNRA